MRKFRIAVKHRDFEDWFDIISITLEKDYTIRAEFGQSGMLKFDTLEEAERALVLVRQDLKRSNGYTTRIFLTN